MHNANDAQKTACPDSHPEFSTSRYVRILMTRWSALAVLVSLGAVAVSGQNAVDETRAREIFKQLVEINTTHSVGSTTTAAEAMVLLAILIRVPLWSFGSEGPAAPVRFVPHDQREQEGCH